MKGTNGESDMENQTPIITMKECKSSNICSYGYCADTKCLRIEFKSGGTYQYSKVPQELFDGLEKSDSKGSYFYSHIRNKFDFIKEGGEE